MACRYEFARVARRDRDRIFDHLLNELGSSVAAKRFGEELDAAVARIRSFPRLYAVSRQPRLARHGYRACFFAGYVLIYRYDDDADSDGNANADNAAAGGTGMVHIARILPAASDYGTMV